MTVGNERPSSCQPAACKLDDTSPSGCVELACVTVVRVRALPFIFAYFCFADEKSERCQLQAELSPFLYIHPM